MNFKRGQITIFIIIAIVIVVGALIYFFISYSDFTNKDSQEINILRQEVNSCLESVMLNTIFSNGLSGGYYLLEKDYLIFEDKDLYFGEKVPFYIMNSQQNIPSLSFLENEVALGVNDYLSFCLSELSFPFEVSYSFEEIDSKISINRNFINIDLFLPTIVRYEDSLVQVNEYKYRFFSDYYSLYTTAELLTKKQLDDLNFFCITCFLDIVEENNLNISTTELSAGKEVILVHSLFNNQTGEVFGFAHKFDFGVEK